MNNRTFAYPGQEKVYAVYIAKTEIPELDNPAGTGLTSAYRRGYHHGGRATPYNRAPLAHAAWAAGKDRKTAELIGRTSAHELAILRLSLKRVAQAVLAIDPRADITIPAEDAERGWNRLCADLIGYLEDRG
jgi:hypothetical protein